MNSSVFRSFCGIIVLCVGVLAQEAVAPPFLLPPTQDAVIPAVRQARATKFNLRVPYSMIDPGPGGAPPPVRTVTWAVQPELPHEESDAIVVGTVEKIQPFLNSNGKGLYSEFTLMVTTIVKAMHFPIVSVGNPITILREGGVARLPTGRIVAHYVHGDNTPLNGQQYLIFLKYDSTVEAFYYSKFWLIQEGVLKAAYPDDLGRARQGQSEVDAKPLSQVLARLEMKVAEQ